MVSLVDIGDLRDTVELRGAMVDIAGVTADHIVGIFYKYPEVRMILTQVQPDAKIIHTLVARAPDAVASLIAAAACGNPEDENFVATAKKLTIGEQYLVLQKVAKLTFPQGVQNFLEEVQGLFEKGSGALGWVPGTTSPAPSSDASPQDEKSETAGTQPQDN